VKRLFAPLQTIAKRLVEIAGNQRKFRWERVHSLYSNAGKCPNNIHALSHRKAARNEKGRNNSSAGFWAAALNRKEPKEHKDRDGNREIRGTHEIFQPHPPTPRLRWTGKGTEGAKSDFGGSGSARPAAGRSFTQASHPQSPICE
jgi:hypothetical protein